MLRKLVKDRWLLLVAIGVIAYIAYFSTFTVIRHLAFNSHYYDLGIMHQVVYNTSKGRILQMTSFEGPETINRLAVHADPLLGLLAPFYWIHDGAETLLVLQSVVLALGAFGLYFIGREFKLSRMLSAVVAIAYLMYPAMHQANIYDFHAVVLATTLLIYLYYFVIRRRWILATVFLVLALMAKENVSLTIAMFGFVLMLQQTRIGRFVPIVPEGFFKKKKSASLDKKTFQYGLLMFLACAVWFFAAIWYVVPNFRGDQHFALDRYDYLGDTPAEMITTAVQKPQEVWKVVNDPPLHQYFTWMWGPVGGAPAFAPQFLIIHAPEFAINLLSTHKTMHRIHNQYTAVTTPFVFIAAIVGISFLLRKVRLRGQLIALIIVLGMLFSNRIFGVLPFSENPDTSGATDPSGDIPFVREWQEKLNDNIPISGSSKLGPHLGGRKTFVRFSDDYVKTDYVFIIPDDIGGDWLNGDATKEVYDELRKNPEIELLHKTARVEVYRRKGLEYDIK